MSLPYSEFPVYISAGGTTLINEVNHYVPSTNVNVSYSANTNPKRNLGKNVSVTDQFNFAGPMTANISVSCILESGAVSGFEFLLDANQDDFVTIRVGSGDYKKCYVNSVGVNIEPFAPVILQAEFTSLEPVTGGQITGDTNPYGGATIPLDRDDVAYGHTATITDNAGVLNTTNAKMSFNRRYSRTPTFELGSINASKMLLDGVEQELTVASTGLNKLIDYSGNKLNNDLVVGLVGVGNTALFDNVGNLITFNQGATVLAQNYSAQGGGVVETSATIKQIKL